MNETTHVCEIDQDELACRILEAQVEMQRPAGMTATEALDTQPDELQKDCRRAAVAALLYMVERLKAVSSVQ